ncbi:beta-N-acetylhexosaminidase [Litorimonas sp. RW-G-Af-16]|uniref:beta-N-acetylhexosaminidase n=1 Tax=Litorimonas sp. RW-G-Af-16 TaxID=3241168 RepID=UPI00390CAD98
MSELAVILGTSGPKLTAAESVFFRDANPWGFILFGRNIETPAQVRRLCADLREAVGRDCLIFIDQEGGRVRRLRPPHWRDYPAASKFATLPTNDPAKRRRAAYLSYRLIADDLRQLGITADCAPVLDLPQKGADPIISDRAFDTHVAGIVEMAHACMAGLMAGGVVPVVKHIPGHGRATVDSHKALPIIENSLHVLNASDFLPFRWLNDAPMAMTAHAVYSKSSRQAVTISPRAMTDLVRGKIGYDGLVMSDDLNMKALSGGLTRLTERTLGAGCDIALQCSGKMADMVKVVKGAKALKGKALMRARIAENCVDHITDFDRESANAEFDALMNLSSDSFVTNLPDPTETWATTT